MDYKVFLRITILFLYIFSPLVLCGQINSFLIDEYFGGKGIQNIDGLYSIDNEIYCAIDANEELLSESITSDSSGLFIFQKENAENNLAHLSSSQNQIELYDFIRIPSGEFLAYGFAEGDISIDGILHLPTNSNSQLFFIYLDENLDYLNSFNLGLSGTINFPYNIAYQNQQVKIALSGIGSVIVDENQYNLGKNREQMAIFQISKSGDTVECNNIETTGVVQIGDQVIINDRWYIQGGFTQDLKLGEREEFNNSPRKDIFLAEISDSKLIKGFSLEGVFESEAYRLNNIDDQLFLTAEIHRNLRPHPDMEELIFEDYVLYCGMYNLSLENEWYGLIHGNFIVPARSKMTGEKHILPITIQNDISYKNLNYTMPEENSTQALYFQLSENGELLESYAPDITNFVIAGDVASQDNELIFSINFFGETTDLSSDFYDGLIANFQEMTSISPQKLTDLEIYPNPTDRFLNINVPTTTEIGRIEIMNSKSVITKTAKRTDNIPVYDISSGVYCIRMFNLQEKIIGTGKFIKL